MERRALGHQCLGPTAPRSGSTGGPQPSLPKRRAGQVLSHPQFTPATKGRSAGPVVMMVMTEIAYKSRPAVSCLTTLLWKVNHCPHLADGETQAQRSRSHTTSKELTLQPQSPTPTHLPSAGWGGRWETPSRIQAHQTVTKHLGVPSHQWDHFWNRTLQETHC